MAGHSRSKNGVASLAYVPAIHVFSLTTTKTWMPGIKPGMTSQVFWCNHCIDSEEIATFTLPAALAMMRSVLLS